MYKEKHILNHHTAGHKLSRYLDVYELNTVNCSADKTTGYKGDTITITGTPAWNQRTSSYSVTGATLTGNQFDFNGSDVTAQANYETAKNVTLQATDGGSIAANRVSGFIGDSVTLSNTPNAGYAFSAYTLTGANLTGSTFNLTGSDVTAKAWFYVPVAKLADTSNYDIWVPKRTSSLAPTVDKVGISFDATPYRYVVYSLKCTFDYDGFVLLRPPTQQSWPSINNHWNFARNGYKLYIAQLSGTNGNYIANIDTWTNGNATVTASISQANGMLAGNYIQCTDFDYYPYFKLILDRQESRVSAYFASNDYSNNYTYQGCATVKTTANSTQLETDCFANENMKVNAKVKVYGCTAFSDATGCYYNK